MEPRDHLADYSSVVASHLLTLAAISDCLGAACPEVGSLYRDRLSRLRGRLSYEPTREKIASTTQTVEAELRDYATAVARYQSQHELELRSAIVVLENLIESTARRYQFHGFQLEQLAAQLEATDVDFARASRLRECVKDLTSESRRMIEKMREEIASVESRLEGTQSTDPVTGLMSRQEMTRQIEAFRMSGCEHALLRFELTGAIGEPVLKQAAERLRGRFRPGERIARWNKTEFLVLFQGPREIAERRGAEIVPLLERYSLGEGARVEATVHLEVSDQDLALA
jgi:GGDEF domain-containing protein